MFLKILSAKSVENMASFRHEEEYIQSSQSDEEELEAPLPLRSEEDWPNYDHHYGLYHTFCSGAPGHYPVPPQSVYQNAAPRHPAHTWQTWQPSAPANQPQTFMESACTSFTQACSVSVNVPHFSLPPAGGLSQGNPGESVIHERRRGAGLSEECKTIFITYSSDAALEIGPFAEFLTRQGFRAVIDKADTKDIKMWRDEFLTDPSILIVIAISPKYKADVNGIAMDDHGRNTKYIYSMMQNEFIQNGSVNFRFIPVLFLNASKAHVPRWLWDTAVYHWPRNSEDLLFRLQRKEKYEPPPVATEISVIIQPVPLCASTPSL